jgi:hypothetical protein
MTKFMPLGFLFVYKVEQEYDVHFCNLRWLLAGFYLLFIL